MVLGQLPKPAFDQIQPRIARWREVNVKARMPIQLLLHLRMFVRGIIVHNQMQVELGNGLTVNRLQKLDPLLMPVSLLALGIECSIRNTQCGEQCCRAIPFVIVRHGPQLAGKHGQAFLSAIKSLNLVLLVH